jgi:hypothetical protein
VKLHILIAVLVLSSCAMGDSAAAPTDFSDADGSESVAAEAEAEAFTPDTVDVDDAEPEAAPVATKPSCWNPVGHSSYDRDTGITDSWVTCY